MNRSEILDGLSRRERGAIQSAQAHSANAARRQDWQRICDSYVATLTPVTDCSAVSTTEMPQHENIVTTPVLEFGDTSIPTFAPDSLLLGLQSQTSTPVIQPERTGFDYQTKNSHGLPGGMIGNFDRPPDVQARIEASNRAEVIGEAIDHPDMSGLSPEMRMAAAIDKAVRQIDQGIHNVSEGISHGVANIMLGLSRTGEALRTVREHAKSAQPDFKHISVRLRMATAAAVASGLMASCAGSIPVPPDQGPGQIQQVTPMVPNKALGIIPVPSGSGSPIQFPDITIAGRPLFGQGETILRATSGTCTLAVHEDLQYKDRLDGARPTALIVTNPIFKVYRNPIVEPNLGSSWYLMFPTLYFANGEPFILDPVSIAPDLVDTGPYQVKCYDKSPQSNFAQAFSEVSTCVTTTGNPYSKIPKEQPHMSCSSADRLSRALPEGSYTSIGTISYTSPVGAAEMPKALPDARNATITPARPTAAPAKPPEQSVQQSPKGPIYSSFDFKCNTGNGSVQLGDKLGKDVVQRVVLDNDAVNELCITGPTKDGEPTGAVVYRRPPDGQFVLTGRLQYDGASECFRDPKTSICLGQGDNYFTK